MQVHRISPEIPADAEIVHCMQCKAVISLTAKELLAIETAARILNAVNLIEDGIRLHLIERLSNCCEKPNCFWTK